MSSRTQLCGTPAAGCRGPNLLLRRSATAVRCFKGSSDNAGAKPSTNALRLNFKVGYRVNFGQSVGMVGSGESLGNWDPKRTVPMKWTDGDLWTVEVAVAPGPSALDLEYKYVVVNADGTVGHWKPGSNYKVTLPLPPASTIVPKRVKVADAWDDSFKKVDVEEAEAPAASSSSKGPASTASKPAEPQPVQTRAQTPPPPSQQPQAQAQKPQAQQPQAAAAKAATNGAPVGSVPPPPAAAAAPAQASTSTSTPPPKQQQQQQQQPGQPAAAKPLNTLPRATSPRSGSSPPSFAAATTIPIIHPTLMAEQDRLEDGVRNSLEDLQAQMDKHQQMRERTNEAKLAAAEAQTTVLADSVRELTQEVASLKGQLAAVQELLSSTSQLLTAVLRQPLAAGGGATQQVFVGAPPGFAAFGAAQQGGAMPSWWQQQPQPAAAQAAPADAGVAPAQPWMLPAVVHEVVPAEAVPAAARQGSVPSPGGPMQRDGLVPVIARRLAHTRSAIPARTFIRRSPGTARSVTLGRGRASRKATTPQQATPQQQATPPQPTPPQPTLLQPAVQVSPQDSALGTPQPAAPQLPQQSVVPPSPRLATARTTAVPAPDGPSAPLPAPPASQQHRVRAAATRTRSASPMRTPVQSSVKAAASAAVLLPVVCGVGRGAQQGARGQFNTQRFRESGHAGEKQVPPCVELQALKREGQWSDVVPSRQVTPLEFVQEGGLKGRNWRASIRVLAGGEVGLQLGEVLERALDCPTQ